MNWISSFCVGNSAHEWQHKGKQEHINQQALSAFIWAVADLLSSDYKPCKKLLQEFIDLNNRVLNRFYNRGTQVD